MLRERIAERLRGFEVHALGDHAHRAAAVAVAVTEEGFGAALPAATHRSSSRPTMPGGRC